MEQHAKNVAEASGVDPNTVIAFLTSLADIVSRMIAGCNKPPTLADVVSGASGWPGTLAMHRALRQNGISVRSHEGRRIEDAARAEAKTMTDSDLALLTM